MLNIKETSLSRIAFVVCSIFLLVFLSSCSRDEDELELATFPNSPDVFIDGFSSGLNYAAFGGSKVTSFDVDKEVKYAGSASMKFEVPDAGDPEGAYTGGVFFVEDGRNLTTYDALTFWARASKNANIDLLGFGNDLGESKHLVSLTNVAVNSNWKKYIIPIPDPSKFTAERGLFYYSEGPENGLGYTFWVDEVKFEKLGTLAHAQGGILNGQNNTISSETGAIITIDGLIVSHNLPTGINQSVGVAASYFTFASSNPAVATVSETGTVTVVDAGEAIITAQFRGDPAAGSLTIQSTGAPILPDGPAPIPTADAADVISMFSNAYQNVPVDTWNPFWEFSTTLNADVKVADDDIKRYQMLNFVGILTEAVKIDASDMTHFHLDFWTPDAIDAASSFKILLVDYGGDGVFGGGDDSSHELEFKEPQLKSGEWVSLDIPLSDFAGLRSRMNIAQLVLSGTIMNVFIDNVYYYKGVEQVNIPSVAATPPSQNSGDVISIYSDSYSNIEGTNFNPDWGQNTIFSELMIEGNNAISYRGLNYQGIELGGSQNISEMDFLHLDYWTDNSTNFNVFLISSGPVESAFALGVPTSGWSSMDIPLSSFNPVDLKDIIQLKFDGNGDIFVDNLYFYKSGSDVSSPTSPAPMPTQEESDVISIYSDAYTNRAGTDFFPNWGQATTFVPSSIDGDNVLIYGDLNYQGIQLDGTLDASEMEMLHIDIWTSDLSNIDIFPISASTGEQKVSQQLVSGSWNSIDIPLSDYINQGLAFHDIMQFKFDAQAYGVGTIYVDNLYFYKMGEAPTAPTSAAPIPIAIPSDVIAVYSDTYTNIAGTDFYPNWGQATTYMPLDIDGNNTIKYGNLNYQGIQLGNTTNAASMEFLHIDIWTPDLATIDIFPISATTGEQKVSVELDFGVWNSIDIPLSIYKDLGLSFEDIIQFKFDAQAYGVGVIYIDNLYFFKEPADAGAYSLDRAIDFEASGFGANWTWNVFENGDNPPLAFVANPDPQGVNTTNTVARFTARADGQPFAGTETQHGMAIGSFTLDESNSIVKIMVYKSVISDVGIKFAQPDGGALEEIKVANTKINEWEELTFDFSGRIGHPATVGQDQIIIFPDFDARAGENVVYFDNITFGPN